MPQQIPPHQHNTTPIPNQITPNLPWRVTRELGEFRTLFDGLDMPYIVEAYICNCGKTKFVVGSDDGLEYICDDCGNDRFYDANYYAKDSLLYDINLGTSICNTLTDWVDTYDWKRFLKYRLKPLTFDCSSYESMAAISQIPDSVLQSARFEMIESNDGLYYKYLYYLPIEIDFAGERVFWGYKEIYCVGIDNSGKVSGKSDALADSKLLHYMLFSLLEHIKRFNPFRLGGFCDKLENLMQTSFFIKHKNLDNIEFESWNNIAFLLARTGGKRLTLEDAFDEIINHNKSKSVKKALFQNYEKQMNRKNRFLGERIGYNFALIYIISRAVTDTNLLVRFLNSPFYYQDTLGYDGQTPDEEYAGYIEQFILFLKKHYSDKQIVKMFEKMEYSDDGGDKYPFDDSVGSLRVLGYDPVGFVKPRLSIDAIHDELSRLAKLVYSENIKNLKLNYTTNQLEACKKIYSFVVRLPANGEELCEWADELRNCMSGYFDNILNKYTIVYVFFEEEKPKFAVEIFDNHIRQALSKGNSKLDRKQEEALNEWYKMFFEKKREAIDKIEMECAV